MKSWIDRHDLEGQPHTSIHVDGHKVGLFPGGWYAYHREYRYTKPGIPKIGPQPVGPFSTLKDAKAFVEAQGWQSVIPFEQAPQTLGERCGA